MGVDSVGSVGGDDVARVAVVVCVCGAFEEAWEEPGWVEHVVVDGDDGCVGALDVPERAPVFGVGSVCAVGAADVEAALGEAFQWGGKGRVVVFFVEPEDDGDAGVCEGFDGVVDFVEASAVGGEADGDWCVGGECGDGVCVVAVAGGEGEAACGGPCCAGDLAGEVGDPHGVLFLLVSCWLV